MAKTDVAVRKNTLPTDWKKQMKEDAAKGVKKVAAIGISTRIKTRGGVLQYMDSPVPGNKLECVVLCDTFENAFYEGEFDASNPQPPICYAFGEDDSNLVPHEKADKKQNDDCKTCPNNKWASAEKGRGKACKNQVRMLLIHADALKGGGNNIDASAAVFLNVPPTSLKGWASHVKSVEQLHGGPIYSVVTEVEGIPQQEGGFKLSFQVKRRITDDKSLGALFMKRKSVLPELDAPYQPIDMNALKKPVKKGAKAAPAPAARQPQRQGARGRF